MEIGGQMLFLLAVLKEGSASQPAAQTGAKTEATAATAPAASGQSAQNGAAGAGDAPPEPVPMDAAS